MTDEELEEEEILEEEPEGENEVSEPLDDEEEDSDETELKHRGATVSVKQDELVNLAQKGFDYETKMKELNDNQSDYAGYEAMKQIMNDRPDVATKVRTLLLNPDADLDDAIRDTEEEQDEEWDDILEDEKPRKKKPSATNRELQALKQQVEVLTNERQAVRQEEHSAVQQAQLKDEVEKYPHLVEAGEVALAPILGLLSVRPDADPKQVVKVVADQFEKYQKKIRSSYLEGKAGAPSSRVQKPGSTPTILTPPRLSSDDLQSGNVRKAAMAFLDQQENNE